MSFAEDGFEILMLLNTHTQCRDSKDRDRAARLWAQDGVLERHGWPDDGERIVGRDAVISFLFDPGHAAEWGKRWFGDARAIKHMTFNPVIEVDGDEASAVTEFGILATLGDPTLGGCHMKLTGKYLDRFRRVEGRWKIAERLIVAQVPDISPAATAAAEAALRSRN